MSDFEFISVILSIIVGLGMTRVLSGLAAVAEQRSHVPIDWRSVGWASGILAWQVLFWLGTVNSWRNSETEWTIGNLSTLLCMSIALFFAAALVLPGRIVADTKLAERYETIRRPFFATFIAMSLFEIADSLLPGIEHLIAQGPLYLFGQGSIFAVGLVGAVSKNRRIHLVLLSYFFGWLLVYATQVWRIS